jgi:hypothetical protein
MAEYCGLVALECSGTAELADTQLPLSTAWFWSHSANRIAAFRRFHAKALERRGLRGIFLRLWTCFRKKRSSASAELPCYGACNPKCWSTTQGVVCHKPRNRPLPPSTKKAKDELLRDFMCHWGNGGLCAFAFPKPGFPR